MKDRQAVAQFLRCRARRNSAQPQLALATVQPFGVLVTGIGGTGVVTVGQIHGDGSTRCKERLVQRARHEQVSHKKAAPVMSHVRLADHKDDQIAFDPRRYRYAADLVIGCDVIVAAEQGCNMRVWASGRTHAVDQFRQLAPTAAFVKNPDWVYPSMFSGSRQYPQGLW